MFTNVAVQVHSYKHSDCCSLSCYYFGKGVVNVYRACALSLAFNTLLSILSYFRDSYFIQGGGGGLGYPPKAQISPPPPKNFIIIINLFSAKYKV